MPTAPPNVSHYFGPIIGGWFLVRVLLVFVALLVWLAGTTGPMMRVVADERPHAPDFDRSLSWLNVSRPVSLADLHGKGVVLDFWTYGCINCMHVIPNLRKLEMKYGSKIAVIGVHSPKFDNEKNIDTLRNIIVRYDRQHPIVSDVNFSLWKRYSVHAWPTRVVIDPAGGVVGAWP
ncbi:MAG: redoxin domain-containing protein [Gammaproteobacteria bacterium]|nr:redoxin domain-containing protein [Gammaproteobacteria bacterium]MCI0590375.1 redoxin domain-containing protein [Gammaproteobacteria bacterium]